MKLYRILALTVLSAIFLTGCDAVRSALGKPTSKDIAELRAQKAQMQRTGDSLAVEMGALPDSLEADGEEIAEAYADTAVTMSLVSVPAESATVEPVAQMEEDEQPATEPQQEEPEEDAPAGLASGYYVVLGSFKNEDNAKYYYNSLSASGADVHLVKMKNGFTAVMICHGNTYDEAYSKMLDFYSDKKKPEDIWIYNTAKKLHIE
ncbi:MAG: SPOR domain-containing protein [Bacteroidales bacterium]|nr:SPOR domain-containing protein [Bacteroidales bacterium]